MPPCICISFPMDYLKEDYCSVGILQFILLVFCSCPNQCTGAFITTTTICTQISFKVDWNILDSSTLIFFIPPCRSSLAILSCGVRRCSWRPSTDQISWHRTSRHVTPALTHLLPDTGPGWEDVGHMWRHPARWVCYSLLCVCLGGPSGSDPSADRLLHWGGGVSSRAAANR